jgi:alkanesulfonate monooxygenase SsuD/methylene tetrahydromethanopterin reductase-like flavin-dependent oxidoreductase (luciferase family)
MSQVGGKVESPMTLLREYTTALYALLQGDTVTTHGRYVHLDRVALDWPPIVVPPLLVGGIGPRTVSLAGELADGLIIPGGQSPDDVQTSVRQFQAGRTATGVADIVIFISVPADGPAAAAAATISEYARAGATHIAVNAAESDADLVRFVGFLAHEVAPLVDDAPGSG